MRIAAIPSLRWRLVAVMCLAYILVVGATEIISYSTQRNYLNSQLATHARADAVILAAGAVAPLRTARAGDLTTLRDVVLSLAGAQGVSYASVFGGDGCVVASTLPRRSPRCLKTPYDFSRGDVSLSNGDIEGRAPVADSSTDLGIAMVVLSGASVRHDLQNTLKSDLLLRAIGLAIFILLSLAIAEYILGPLTVLARAANAISGGDMETRLPTGGRTELAQVAAAFNDMATALEQRIDHLSFLADTAPELPTVFRHDGDSTSTLREFCRQLGANGAVLIFSDKSGSESVWYDADPADTTWREPAAQAPTGTQVVHHVQGGWSIMVVPVVGDAFFVTVRRDSAGFSHEEEQVITNFAYQLSVAADNARLFEAQQEALQVKDQFLSIVSHELRTPLTTIKGYAQMLRRKLADDPNGLRFALNIDAQVGRLSRLVDDLLDVTRFSRSEFELKRQRVDMRPLLEDVAARFRIVSPAHSVAIHLDAGGFEGNWDRDRLEQVMNNLVGNAVKYSPAGGTVTIATGHEDGYLVVGVQDQGAGIPDEDQKRLFDLFFRGNAEGGNVKGLGLGLYVTQRIVEAHGGKLSVTSKENEGSTFSFTLPLTVRVPAASVVG